MINTTNVNDVAANDQDRDQIGTIHYVGAGNASDIQAKIYPLPTSGGMVFVPPGVYSTTAIGSYDEGDNDYNKIVSNTFRRVRIYFASNEVKGNFNRHNIIVNNIMNGENSLAADAGVYIEPSKAVSGFVDDAYNLISENKIYNYNSRAIYLKESCSNTITENECWNNGKDGILLWMHSDYNTVSNNNCHNNTDCGIMLKDFNRYNLVTDNYCNNNEKDGIMVYKSGGNIVSDNYLYQNGYCGLWLHVESDSNTITGNIAANNGWNIDGAGAAKAPYSGIRLDSNCDNIKMNAIIIQVEKKVGWSSKHQWCFGT